jgi:hypothetical protein
VSATPEQRLPKWLLILLTPYLLLASALSWILAMLIGIPMTILFNTVLRGRCYHCGRRGLRGARAPGDETVHPGDSRPFHFSECDYCKYQFHTFDGRSRLDIPPGDPRYVTV